MLTTPVPDAAETRANAAFDAILWALSRPGLPRSLPVEGEPSVIEALVDRECQVFAADPLLIPLLVRSGARLVDLPRADHVFLGRLTDLGLLTACAVGSDLYPDEGATVVVRVRLGQGPRLRLTGPGVDGAVEVQVDGLPEGVWEARARRIRYPMGFDMLLIDGDRLVGLPRSTTVEEI